MFPLCFLTGGGRNQDVVIEGSFEPGIESFQWVASYLLRKLIMFHLGKFQAKQHGS